MIHNKLTLSVLMICLCLVSACSNDSQDKAESGEQQILTLSLQKNVRSLFFNGIINPISVVSVVSPLEGSVIGMHFNYGQFIKKGQLLFEINSNQLDKNYQQAVSGFLQAKREYTTNQKNIEGSRDLFKAGLISRQQHQSAETSLANSFLALLQAERSLVDVLRKTNISAEEISLLRLGDLDAVKKALTMPISNFKIYADGSGIALRPLKSGRSGNQNSNPPVAVGSVIKAGDVLISIGDMQGLGITVNINEINVNQIQPGQQAIITSAAFPGITLEGEVDYVSFQANTGGTGGLPAFPVRIVVKSVTPKQLEMINVGMSAKVQINIERPSSLMIPLSAIIHENGKTQVNVIDPKTGTPKKVTITTGETSQNSVRVESGLKVGDKIVVGN